MHARTIGGEAVALIGQGTWQMEHDRARAIDALRLVEQGKVRHFGVSNFDEHEIEEAARIAGPGRIACNQLCYHLAERHIEQAVIPACERHGIAVVGYSPFGSGRFPSQHPVLADIAGRRGATPHQVALAFLARQALVLPKASSRAHALENAGAADLTLAPEDVSAMDEAFPVRVRAHLPII